MDSNNLQHVREHRTALNQLINTATQQFLLLSGLKPGMKVLDVGCGLGFMSFWIAEIVGPEGSVTALESNDDYLNIAKEIAAEESLDNITFAKMSVGELAAQKENYDFVYTRFFMLRFQNPIEIIQLIHDALKEKGIFASESIILGREYCYPHSDAYDKWRQLNAALCSAQGKDPQTGMKMYNLMQEAKFDIAYTKLLQPVLTKHTQRQHLIYNDLQEHIPDLVEKKLADENSLAELAQDLKMLIDDPEVFMVYSQTCHLAGIKP